MTSNAEHVDPDDAALIALRPAVASLAGEKSAEVFSGFVEQGERIEALIWACSLAGEHATAPEAAEITRTVRPQADDVLADPDYDHAYGRDELASLISDLAQSGGPAGE